MQKLDKYAKASQKGKSGLLLGVKDGDRVCIVGAAMLPDGQLKNLAKGIKEVKDVTSGKTSECVNSDKTVELIVFKVNNLPL